MHTTYYTCRALCRVYPQLLNLTQKHNCSDQGCPVPAMATTALRICTEIENFKLRACTQVWDYITNTQMEQIIWTMAKSMHGSFQEFISGIKNWFIDLEYVWIILCLGTKVNICRVFLLSRTTFAIYQIKGSMQELSTRPMGKHVYTLAAHMPQMVLRTEL
jgi:hypothetical protein